MEGHLCNCSHYLIFGGNGFIGFEFVLRLLEHSFKNREKELLCCEHQHKINLALVNREKSWDWDKLSLISKYCDVITRIKWNRKKSLQDCKSLVDLVCRVRNFCAVIDFSAYEKFALEESLSLLRGKCSLYIYISTDSVYEVCGRQHSGPIRETDATRPRCRLERERLNKLDKYGHRKLECEESLILQGQYPDAVPYVIFRLADVFGMRDSTNRFWQYMLWLKLCSQFNCPLFIPSHLDNRKISLVYVSDVADLLVKIVCSDPSDVIFKGLQNQLFNLAFPEQFTTKEVLKFLAKSLDLNEVDVQFSMKPDVPVIYPSVDCGPIDVSKAQSVLLWDPVSCLDAINETVEFYQSVASCSSFYIEKLECIEAVIDDITDIYSTEPLNCRAECKRMLKMMLNVN